MHVSVNGVRLFFDVEGAKLVPDGPAMREKPTLLLLHGGPGFDHSIYRPAYSALADIAQIIYLDHRGNGRSEDGPRESWNLAQWGDDVRAFCDALGIVDPIVLGASFGGMVALAYATRHPAHPSKLVLISTEATGGSYRGAAWRCSNALAARRSARWRAAGSWNRHPPDQASLDAWRRLACRSTRALPAIQISNAVRSAGPRCCNGLRRPGGESGPFDLFPDLGRIHCPTLFSAEKTILFIRSKARRILPRRCPAHLVQFERFADCRHAVIPDAPERAMVVIRDFIILRR